MSEFNHEIRRALHERLTQIRGRRVSYDKVCKACDRHLGHFGHDAFEHLFNEIREPWQLRILWDGPDRDLPNDGRLAWYPSRDDALVALVGIIDQYRIYPDSIETEADGRIVLFADDGPIFELEPLRYHQPDPSLLSEAQDIFAGRSGNWRGEVLLRAARLTKLACLHRPHGSFEEHWNPEYQYDNRVPVTDDNTPITHLGTQGLLQFSPDSAAAACVAVGAQLNILLPIETARQLLADVMGLDNWEAFKASWLANQVFQPYLFHDKVARQSFFCRDAAAALATFAGVADTLERPENFEWDIRADHADGFTFTLNGPLRFKKDKRFNWTYRDSERERADPLFHRVLIEVVGRGQFHHTLLGPSPGTYRRDFSIPAGVDTAQCLRDLLGVDLPGTARVRLSDIRSQVRAIDAGGVHITKGRHHEHADVDFFYECLNPTTGRRDRHLEARCLTDAIDGKVWHEEGEHELVRTRNGDMTLCETRAKKRPVRVRWRALSEEEEDSLIAFLGMTLSETGAAYPQELREKLRQDKFDLDMALMRSSFSCFRIPQTFRERRLSQGS